jgi:hypothetical protein
MLDQVLTVGIMLSVITQYNVRDPQSLPINEKRMAMTLAMSSSGQKTW